MPNWCYNNLQIQGRVGSIAKFKKRAVGFSPWLTKEERDKPDVLNFASFVAVPKRVLRKGYSEEALNWEFAHWGCKWGAVGPELIREEETFLEYEFRTPWEPPLAFIKQVSRWWWCLEIVLQYKEEDKKFRGMAYAGLGKLVDRRNYDPLIGPPNSTAFCGASIEHFI